MGLGICLGTIGLGLGLGVVGLGLRLGLDQLGLDTISVVITYELLNVIDRTFDLESKGQSL